MENILGKTEAQMKGRLDKFLGDMASVRTGRANPQILDSIRVECYGQELPIKQLAAISVPEGRTLEIRPWDPSTLEALEKALQKSDLGIPPQNDGKMIRLQLPAMTEERRKELVKLLGKMAEEARVALRNERRDGIEKLRKAEKAKEISEDERKRQEDSVQKLTDAYIRKVDEALAAKEKEVTTV
ncbi:MAG: ribosome recycling factor [Elusimicrobia bacterium]|nr:ribosome recycling factor [Elusimicrobiota bacterium]